MSIANSIKILARQGLEVYLRICTVDAVDEQARTIDCTPLDEGAPFLAVNLQADQEQSVGLVSFPKVGSDVVVGFLNPAVAVVVLMTEIDKSILTIGDAEITVAKNDPDSAEAVVTLVNSKLSITASGDNLKIDVDGTTLEMDGSKSVWNGGSETTANATELKKQLTTMSTRIDSIINAISSSPVVPQDGGAGYQKAMATALSSLTKEDFSQMIDDKIKH